MNDAKRKEKSTCQVALVRGKFQQGRTVSALSQEYALHHQSFLADSSKHTVSNITVTFDAVMLTWISKKKLMVQCMLL